MFFERLNVSVQKLENAIEFYGAISHNKLHGLSVQVETNHVKLPAVVDGFASEGIIQFFFEETQDENGFNIYILDESNRVRCITTAKAAKRNWCVTSVASTRHRTTASPTAQAHQLQPAAVLSDCEGDGREQVIPFRTKSIGNMPLPIRITIRRYYSNIFRDERAGKRGLSGMQS
ncbi:adenylate cyclase [Escherichia coli]|uniref:Adenylate cyclase n=1 Tax=Escherichia coli TaxID=562 RepID=A0A376U007_ECOLX|nr:adenylate cyclase [Escherichia coli]